MVVPALGLGRSFAGERRGVATEAELRLDVERKKGIKLGCAWLAAHKNGDGSFGDAKAIVAFTALSALALMSDGSSINRGPYGEQVRMAIDFLVKLVETPARHDVPDGFFARPNDISSKMHGQGYATLALASAIGSADEEFAKRIRAVLVKAVRVCEDSQTGTGGWGYSPMAATEHEGSVTVTIAQGLRAARDAGIKVNGAKIRYGLRYLDKSQKNLPGQEEDGSFKYSLMQEKSSYALTSAAISAYALFGEYGSTVEERDRITRGINFIKRRLPRVIRDHEWLYYGNFYAAWAAWQKDGDQPDPLPGQSYGIDPTSRDIERTTQFWGPWHSKVYPYILSLQRADGHWNEEVDEDKFNFGELLPTAFAVLTLAIPDELVPIFQR